MGTKKYKEALGIYLAAFFLDPMDIEITSAMADCCSPSGIAKEQKNF
jgi:hypothetical protein